MDEPVTTFDARFSDPTAVATEWEETRRILQTAELFWISTVRADGRPHVTPLVAVWHDGAIHFCTGATEQKAVNLSRNPHVILMTGCNHWDRGIEVVVEGDAVQLTDNDALKRLARAWGAKWDDDGHSRYAMARFTTALEELRPFSRSCRPRSSRSRRVSSARHVTDSEICARCRRRTFTAAFAWPYPHRKLRLIRFRNSPLAGNIIPVLTLTGP